MKKSIVIILVSLLVAGSAAAFIIPGESACEAAETGQLNIPVKQLHSAPDENSTVVYDIPITVELLEVGADGNWHKVKISYAIGPFSYTYVGWTYIPVAKILAEREAKELAALLEEPQ
ncbi:MAG: hypothetical protein JW782_05440 [Candidatus Saganbacteria bacterium]|nr:hypothetical protein [Candidatus Saganbacteria bacterium]